MRFPMSNTFWLQFSLWFLSIGFIIPTFLHFTPYFCTNSDTVSSTSSPSCAIQGSLWNYLLFIINIYTYD